MSWFVRAKLSYSKPLTDSLPHYPYTRSHTCTPTSPHMHSSDHISHHHRKTKIASFHSSMTGRATAHITGGERNKKQAVLAAQSARDGRLPFNAAYRPTLAHPIRS